MALKIRLKHSSVKDKAPLPADLEIGELAINAHQDSPAAYIKDNTGAIVKLAGAGNVGATAASATAAGVVQLADAAAITAGTAGRVVDAAQLKAVSDGDDWTRTGTTLAPKTAGDVVSFSAGTAALPGLTPVGDPNTGLWAAGADTLGISTNGVERLRVDTGGTSTFYSNPNTPPAIFNIGTSEAARIDSNGRLGIGTSSPASELQVRGASGNASVLLSRGGAANPVGDAFLGALVFSDSANSIGSSIIGLSDSPWAANSYPGRLAFYTTASGSDTPTERLRIDSSGRLLVGISATVAGSTAKLQCATTANLGAVAVYADNAAALAGGLVAGDIYRKADGTLMITF